MAATPAGFAQLTHLLMGLAGGRLILSLEVSDSLLALSLWALSSETMLRDIRNNAFQSIENPLPNMCHILAGQSSRSCLLSMWASRLVIT